MAGTSIRLILGQNGIITQAKRGQKNYSEQEAREKLELVLLDLQTKKQIDETISIDCELNQNGIIIIEEDIVLVNGWK